MARQPDLNRARPSGVAAEVTLVLQGRKLVRHARSTGQSDRLANLAHRRRIAALLHRLADNLQYFSLPPSEHMVRIWLVRQVGHRYGNAAAGFAARLALASVIAS